MQQLATQNQQDNTNSLATLAPEIISQLVLSGDLKSLSDMQKVQYYNYRCQQAGLDPAAKPFDLLTLNGKQVLYANAGCTQQLTSNRQISVEVLNKESGGGIFCVTVRVTDMVGRSSTNIGVVSIDGLKGDALCNAMMKGVTKAIRRTVLAFCGLGMLDETEVQTIPNAVRETLPQIQGNTVPAPATNPELSANDL